MRIACVGDNCVDRYLPPLGYALIGGNALNVAVNLARIGCRSSYYGAAGADTAGHRVKAALLQNGVDAGGLRLLPDRSTATTDIATTADGERHFLHEDFGACQGYRPSQVEQQTLAACDHVHIGWLDDGGALKRALHEAGVSLSQDLSVNADPANRTPDHLAIAFAAAPEAEAEVLARRLVTAGARRAVVTMGPVGSLSWDGHILSRMPAPSLQPLDTTGAGDSFIAGFLSELLLTGEVERALQRGTDEAAETCLHLGGFSQLKVAT